MATNTSSNGKRKTYAEQLVARKEAAKTSDTMTRAEELMIYQIEFSLGQKADLQKPLYVRMDKVSEHGPRMKRWAKKSGLGFVQTHNETIFWAKSDPEAHKYIEHNARIKAAIEAAKKKEETKKEDAEPGEKVEEPKEEDTEPAAKRVKTEAVREKVAAPTAPPS